jgi:GMP synthase-like glutamine amidotransferase
VAKLPHRQAGFRLVALTGAGERDPLLGALPRSFAALFANAYSFDVPATGIELISGDCRPQAFRVGERAWGVQFHPEARRDQVLAWWSDGRDLPRPLDELTAEIDAGMGRWEVLGRLLCRAFLQVAAI